MNEQRNSTPRTFAETEQIKAQWKASGKSKKQFAADQGINYMTFIGWFSRKAKTKSVPKVDSFIPIAVQDSAGLFAEVYLGNGKRIVFHQPVSVHYFQLFVK
jgi:hypothetical protein